MYNLYDIVNVKDSGGNLIKRGVIVGLTTIGALIHNPTCEKPYVDLLEFPEWFPFNSKETKMENTGAKYDKILKKH